MAKKVESDGTTDMTTSHLTNPAKDAGQVIGYSHSTKPASRQDAGYIDVGTGDVFVDLGFQDSGERKLRVQLAIRINELLQDRKLTQAKTAALFGIPTALVKNQSSGCDGLPGET